MKRIAIVASAFHPSLGGVEELVRQQAKQFAEMGVESLVVTNQWPRTLPSRAWVGEVPVLRLPFRFPGVGWRSELTFLLSARRVLQTLEEELRDWGTELIHVQCVSTNGWYAMRVADRLDVPLVVSSQGERTMDAGRAYQRFPLMNRLLRATLRRADGVSACSQATLEDLRRYQGGNLRGGGRVIYNGVGRELFEPVDPWPHPRPYLLSLGRMVPQKGFRDLIEAFAAANLRGVDLVLAGEGPQEDELRELVRERGLSERVSWAGRADRGMVAALMSGCRGLVVPSIREPMGIVALEGLAQGKSVVASRVDGLQEVVPEGDGTRHFTPGSIKELKSALVWLAEESPECFDRNREWAQRFRWETICAQYLDWYGSVASDRRRSGELSPEGESACLSSGGQVSI
jgi:glycogen(starch) synthase